MHINIVIILGIVAVVIYSMIGSYLVKHGYTKNKKMESIIGLLMLAGSIFFFPFLVWEIANRTLTHFGVDLQISYWTTFWLVFFFQLIFGSTNIKRG